MTNRGAFLQSLVGQAGDWVEDGAEALRGGIEQTSDRVARGARRASRRAARLVRRAGQRLEAARRRVEDLGVSTRELVVEHPGKALLAASAAGFLLGVVVARRRR